MTLRDKSIMEPTLTDTLNTLKTDIFRNLNCVKIGQIVSFNGANRTAKVQIQFRRVLPNEQIGNYPVLVDCPVFTLQGGGASIQFPIMAGDQCILLFADRNIDTWFQTGAQDAPPDSRCHDLSDGIALVGINSLANPLPTYMAGTMQFSVGTGELVIGDGDVELRAAPNAAELDLIAQIVTLKNGTTSLLTLLSGLIDVIKTLQVNGPLPLTAPSIAALEAYKTVLATLLG